MELIIAICFFAITSAVCVQVFVRAHLISSQTTDLNHAIAQAQSMAEAFDACGGLPDAIGKLYPEGYYDGQTLTVAFDDQWQLLSDRDSAAYILVLAWDQAAETIPEGGLISADITIKKAADGAQIYSLTVKKFAEGA